MHTDSNGPGLGLWVLASCGGSYPCASVSICGSDLCGLLVYGLVELRKGLGGTVAPRVPYSGIDLAISLDPRVGTDARGWAVFERRVTVARVMMARRL